MESRTDNLRKKLLELEVFQIEQYEDLISQFEEKYIQVKSATVDSFRQFFEKMRDNQTAYFEKIKETAQGLLTRFQANDDTLTRYLKEEQIQVLADKDAFMTGIVAGSHEFRIAKIDAKDEEISKREVAMYDALTKKIQSDEKERSRTRTDDVMSMVLFFDKEIEVIKQDA